MAQDRSIILGVGTGHGDSSAALIVNGVLVAAAEEERFTRIKHYALFPHRAIQYCLKHAKIDPENVKILAIARQPRAHFWKRVSLYLSHPALFRSNTHRRNNKEESFSESLTKVGLSQAKVVRVEHHLAHLFSARFLYPKEDIALLSIDGLGDFASAAMGKPNGNQIEILDQIVFPHSLGFFYTAMTHFLGFPHYGDEFKVMGLSSYGEPKYLSVMRELIREKEGFRFELNLEAFPLLKRPMEFFIDKAQPRVLPFFSNPILTHMIGLPARKPTEPLNRNHWNLAQSVQKRFEEIANHLLKEVHRRIPSDTIALAGGCAHNSVWVGKIRQETAFRRVAVAPAANDAGIAVGAAIAVAQQEVSVEGNHWGLIGPEVSSPPELSLEGFAERKYSNDKKKLQFLVSELAESKIIGFCEGRMEFGPRALGSRSILADPRSATMKQKLNARVKHREEFRPFAASVLEEHQGEWFENVGYTPYMEAVYVVRPEQRKKIPAVVHVDNTCRIQTVSRDTQPMYWALIDSFRKRTGIPMLLNTSFNDSEPIVCNEQDAVRCFLNTEMDYLVLNGTVYEKRTLAKKAG